MVAIFNPVVFQWSAALVPRTSPFLRSCGEKERDARKEVRCTRNRRGTEISGEPDEAALGRFLQTRCTKFSELLKQRKDFLLVRL